jgi:2-isopropylmalate synthase
MTDKLIIFDTTLRDGEQSPGASMTTRREAAHRAASSSACGSTSSRPASRPASNGDFEAVQAIADAIKRHRTVCSLARANDRDIARAAEALRGAQRARIHTFIATSRRCTWRRSCA